MKKSIRKIFALVLTFVIIFSISVVPVSAKNIYEKNNFMGLIEVYDYGNEEDKTFFEKIKDTFHWYIARIFICFEADCPICGEHFLPPEISATVDYYNNAINSLKAYEGVVTIKKVSTTNVAVVDVPSTVASLVNQICNNFAGTIENTYTFASGKTVDGIAITDVVEPLGRNATLTEKGICGSHAKINAEANIPRSLRIQLVSETESFDGTSTVNAVHNASVIKTINFATLDLLGDIKITSADTTYPGTQIYAQFDDLGRITSLSLERPFELRAKAKADSVSITGNFKVDMSEEYTITYVS
jgi:hypothetical protein